MLVHFSPTCEGICVARNGLQCALFMYQAGLGMKGQGVGGEVYSVIFHSPPAQQCPLEVRRMKWVVGGGG